MATENLAPIVIKKKNIIEGDGHHGGAWKVAYADFVTAMMAFFLLMWLLNATTEKQRKGLADYFSPSIPIHKVSGGGDGQLWGDSVFAEDVLPQNGTGSTMQVPSEGDRARGATGVTDAQRSSQGREERIQYAEQLLENLQARGGESMAQLEELRYVVSKLTEEGLVFEIFETEEVRLFTPNTDQPTPELRLALLHIGGAMRLAPNAVAVRAHLATQPLVVANNPVWDLSMTRAQAARLLLQRVGFPADRVEKVTGYADRKPAVLNPMSRRNNRVELVLLRPDL